MDNLQGGIGVTAVCKSALRLGSIVLVLLCLSSAVGAEDRIPLAIRGSVAVNLLPDSDTLTIRIQKRDLNMYEGEDVLVGRLLAPDRTLLETITIPDDGSAERGTKSGEVQEAKRTIKTLERGVYVLHLGPQGGSDQVFGFETDCRRYMIEGPICLNDASLHCDICFMPPKGAFKISAQAVHEGGRQKLPLYDGEGKLVNTLDLAKVMEPVSCIVPADWPRSDKRWRFPVEREDVRIQIQGVAFWTNASESYFPVSKMKWMLTPYRLRVFLLPGASADLTLSLRNSSTADAKFILSKDSPAPAKLELIQPASPVELTRGQTRDLRAVVEVPPDVKMGTRAACHITAAYADDPALTATSSIQVEVGESPVKQFLNTPIALRPYEHENAQFGYLPEYPCNPPFFDLANRPYIRTRGSDPDVATGIQTLADGSWVEKSFLEAIRAKYPSYLRTEKAAGWEGTKIVFDRENHAYTLLTIRVGEKSKRRVLLYSPDGFDTFQVYELPQGEYDTEQWTGHNVLPGPPPILVYEKTADHPARFCSYNNLRILLPEKKNGGLALGEPILVSDKCIGPCRHSGNPSPTATCDGRTHIVWGEVDDSGVPGVPTYVATVFHDTRKVSEKVLLAHAPPVNDCHNQPGICLDSEGYLHVLTGAHGRPLKYLRSLKPNDACSGWTSPEDILHTGHIDRETGEEEGRQTYLSLLCDSKDTLHIAFRQWRRGVDEHLSGLQYAALSYQRKKKGQPWEDARPLVAAAVPGYSIWYHKMTLDRRDRLYLSYSYWTKDETYQNDFPGRYNHRAVITSPDGGDHWKLAETADFVAGINAAK